MICTWGILPELITQKIIFIVQQRQTCEAIKGENWIILYIPSYLHNLDCNMQCWLTVQIRDLNKRKSTASLYLCIEQRLL